MPQIELPQEEYSSKPGWFTKDQMRAILNAAEREYYQFLSEAQVLEAAVAAASRKQKPSASRAHERAVRRAVVARQLWDFILIAYFTGARRGSIEKLQKSQVDLANNRINLHPPGAPLTSKRKPIVPIYREIRPAIKRLMAESTTQYIFGHPAHLYRQFYLLLQTVHLDGHPHMLRHSRATHMLMDGEDPYKVARLLGDSLITIERVYGHHSADYLETGSTL